MLAWCRGNWNVTVEPVEAVVSFLNGQAVDVAAAFVQVSTAVTDVTAVAKSTSRALVSPFLSDVASVRILNVALLAQVLSGGANEVVSYLRSWLLDKRRKLNVVLLCKVISLRWQFDLWYASWNELGAASGDICRDARR